MHAHTVSDPFGLGIDDSSRLLETIITEAVGWMEIRKKQLAKADERWELGSAGVSQMYMSLASGSRVTAYALGHIIRAQIATRTQMEALEALLAVRNGDAAFLTPACAGETCGDCDRPLWHHIRVGGDQTYCPFGRRFWQLARALQARDSERAGLDAYNLAAIARGACA